MGKIKDFISNWIWQLPQNLCGLVYKLSIKKDIISIIDEGKDFDVYLKRSNGGITLGKYIFVYQKFSDISKVIQHESGHVKQSIILGPLYLIVIGLPSILWAGFIHKTFFKNKSYYWFYTESWANKLAKLTT